MVSRKFWPLGAELQMKPKETIVSPIFAVRYFIEYFKQYLLEQKFILQTDHKALVWHHDMKEPKGTVARWIDLQSA